MSLPNRIALTVPEDQHGALLEDVLARRLDGVHRTEVRRLVAEVSVRVNGMECARNVRVRSFDYVEFTLDPATPLRPAPRSATAAPADVLTVLAEGADWLVVDKPAGLVTVPDRAKISGGVHGLLPQLRPDADLRIVHRLDRDTSGCLLLAKGLVAAQHFDAAFRAGAVHKQYVALVHGALPDAERTIDLPLAPDSRRPGKSRIAEAAERDAKPAHTAVAVTAVHGTFTLVQLQPRTGRSHQLRVHLAAIGHPIVADADYGGRPLLLSELKRGYKLRRGTSEPPLLARMFLHAQWLRFPGLDGGEVAVEAPLPTDLQTALDRVARAARAKT